MVISFRQLAAPFVGWFLAWCTAHGLDLGPAASEVLCGLLAGLAGGAWHIVEVRLKLNGGPLLVPPADSSGGSSGAVPKAFIAALAAGLLLHLAGCAALGATAPRTPAERLGYAYGGIVAALNTLAQTTSAGLLTREEARAVNQDVLAAGAELDTARGLLCGTDPKCQAPTSSSAGLAAITAATAALTHVSTYLACKQAKGAKCLLP